ncbi:MAG: amidohydrolase family protein [Alphaproteobacteria bacterium]|nr:amidohydrolase family protein [Alphaproteobacteria bacterium]
MFKTQPEYQYWDRNPRRPAPPPPPGSCDCQFHIYADPAVYPTRPNPPYEAIDATFSDARAMHRAIGFDHGVIVHSGIYGTDASLMVDALNALPAEERRRYRGIAVIDDKITDAEMDRLNRAGVVGVRINFDRQLKMTPSGETVRTILKRVEEIGWHVRVHVRGNDLIEHSDILRSVKDVDMSIDHLGHVDLTKGLDQAACRWILDILTRENWWMMVSNGNRDSVMESGWDDAVPFGKAFIEAAPDRAIWGTDWPHPSWRKKRMMNDAEEVELLYRYVDHDETLIRKILVDNPKRLHGFRD